MTNVAAARRGEIAISPSLQDSRAEPVVRHDNRHSLFCVTSRHDDGQVRKRRPSNGKATAFYGREIDERQKFSRRGHEKILRRTSRRRLRSFGRRKKKVRAWSNREVVAK